MLETKSVGDNFSMLATNHVTNIQKTVANINSCNGGLNQSPTYMIQTTKLGWSKGYGIGSGTTVGGLDLG